MTSMRATSSSETGSAVEPSTNWLHGSLNGVPSIRISTRVLASPSSWMPRMPTRSTIRSSTT
jgi:hypothetical protein